MKRISFKVAKAIKEAGYPQDIAKEEYLFDINGNPSTGFEQCEEFVRPTYLEVWLWLWREKHIIIDPDYSHRHGWYINDFGLPIEWYPDPEEAIVKTIEYFVDNKLLK